MNYIVQLCERNKNFFPEYCIYFYTKHTRQIFPNQQGEGVLEEGLILIIKTPAGQLCLSNKKFTPTDGFTMVTMSKGWRDGGDVLAIPNNQHAPNRYSKAYLIKYNICKLS